LEGNSNPKANIYKFSLQFPKRYRNFSLRCWCWQL